MIQVNKNIPLPKNIESQRNTYPYKDMKSGDSFFVAGESALKRIKKSLSNLKMSDQFVVQEATENKVQGARCWKR